MDPWAETDVFSYVQVIIAKFHELLAETLQSQQVI